MWQLVAYAVKGLNQAPVIFMRSARANGEYKWFRELILLADGLEVVWRKQPPFFKIDAIWNYSYSFMLHRIICI
jgi:hypothetical protein